ncbi:MAG: hypothetical protein WC022_00145 [Parcubacteria group bacterium]
MLQNKKTKNKEKEVEKPLKKSIKKALIGKKGYFAVQRRRGVKKNDIAKAKIIEKIEEYDPEILKTVKSWNFSEKRKDEFFIRQTLEEYVSLDHTDKKDLGKAYFWNLFLGKFVLSIKQIFRQVFKAGFKFSYRAISVLAIAFLVYGISPAALCAPKSVAITTKADWDLGQFSGVTTQNSVDSIQMEPSGTWTARTWASPEDTIGFGHSSVMVGDYLYVFRGYSGDTFWRYDTIKNTWSTMAGLPQPAFYGADMTYLASTGKIYAMFGGYSQKFYSYDIDSNSWTKLTDMLDTPWTGAAMEGNGTSIFIVRGNASTDFWEYDTVSSSWINRPPITAAVGAGADIVNGQDGNLYLVRGSGTQTFYRYDIAGHRWYATVAQLPSTCGAAANAACTFGNEQKGVYRNGKLYFMRSNGTQDMLQYDISGNAWTALTTDMTPQAVNYGSLTLNTNDNLIYAFRANGTTDFWKFDPDAASGQKWVGPKQVQTTAGVLSTVGTGSDLVWNQNYGGNNYVYAIQGRGTTGFFVYNVANNSWTTGTVLPISPNSDMKGAINPANGALYYPRSGSANILIYSGGTAGTWANMSPAPPIAPADGASVAFQGTNLYYRPGNGSQNIYRYNGTSWSAAIPMATVDSGTTTTYYANTGGRMISDGTNVYATLGDGETTFLKYDGSAWLTLSATPFSQYYGSDMTYDSVNSKIYALAGLYKNETWEYDIATDVWRRLPNNQKYTFDRGPYNGASIEYSGNTSLYATTGQSLSDIWSYTVSATNFPTSGTYTYASQMIDLGQVSSGSAFTFNEERPANTSTKYELCTNADGAACSSWHNVTDGVISDLTIGRYVWVKVTLSTSDGASTPTVNDYTISYASSDTVPSSPTTIVAKSQQVDGSDIVADTEYAYEHPYFSWTAGADNGSGIDGYYVYWGKNSSADPASEGSYQATGHYTVNEAMNYDTSPVHPYGTYYLIVKAKDKNGLVSDAWSAFTYKYKGVSPSQVSSKTLQSDFNKAGADFDDGKISYSAVDGSMRLSNTSGFWNQARLSASPYYTHIGGQAVLGGCKTTGQSQLSGNHCVYTFQGNNQLVFMRYEIETDTWINSTANIAEIKPALSAVNNGGTMVAGPEGYLYATKGVTTPTFWRYDIANAAWTQIDDAPKNFDYGSVLTYDDSRYIYAMPGNDDATYRYDTCNGQDGSCSPQWTQLTNAQFGNPNTVDGQKTYEGADGIYDGRNNMYVMQGNYYPYMAKYSIADDEGRGEVHNTWTSLSAAPVGFYNGGSLSFDGDHTIYALAGNSRMKFMKYDTNTDAWSFLPDAPATISYGASLVFHNGYLYATRGGTYTTFYRYNTIDNTWEIPNHNFFGNTDVTGAVYLPYSNGASMADDGGGNIYIYRGGFDNTFGRYNSSTGVFTTLSKLPMGAGNGANIVYNGTENAIYYVSGNTIRTRRTGTDTQNPYFFKYDITSNTWSQITTDRPLAQIWLGSSMTYDGSQYIYLTQGNGTSTWWKYDTLGAAGSRWSAMSTVGSCSSGDGSKILYVSGTIFRTQGAGSTTNCKFSISNGTWSTLGALFFGANSGSSLVDGKDGYIYLARGGNTNSYYRYNISQSAPGSWENLTGANIPAQVTTGGWGVNSNNRNWFTSGAGGGITFPDGLYSYIVGSSTNATGFIKTGTYTSEPIDLTQAYKFANLSVSYILPINTALEIQTRTSSNGSTWGDWTDVSEDHSLGDSHTFSINSSVNEYIQIRMIFSSSDQVYSPRVDDFAINYYQDLFPPDNPTGISAYDTSVKTNILSDNTWHNYTAPYFEWPVANSAGGAVDNQGGSGIAGYYVCFGNNTDCVDPYVDGSFQMGNSFVPTGMVSGQDYHLRIKAVDNAGMFLGTSFDAFTYRFDDVAPTNPSEITADPIGYSSADAFIFTWSNDVGDANSGVAKFQYRTGGDAADIWYDISDPYAVSQSVAPYQANKNTFYLRAVDNAGNVSAPMTMDYFYSGGAASPPQNLVVSPDTVDNQTNSFTFTWDVPTSYAGDVDKLTYFYSVNYLPTPFNTIETTAKAAGPGPFATQFGKNTMYVVAMNEGGTKTNPNDVDWDHPASVDFYAKTTAPGPPVNMQVFDTSDREAEEYSVAVKWSVPQSYDSGNFAGYTIYRSLDGTNFVEAATTTGTAYVDTELESKEYYYYVRSRDKTNNLSIATSTLFLTPTGRYTTPPTIVSKPSVSVQSFAASFEWSTNRLASSFVEYGTKMSLGKTNGQVDSLTAHKVDINGLEAATKYYYRVKFIDPDGNIGTSEIGNFTTNDPPTISDVLVDGIGLDSATVSWSTNMSGTCTLKYGEGGFSNSIEESGSGTTHIQKITGLKNATPYAYQVDCVDADDNTFDSDQYTFNTLEQPRVENLTVQNKENVDIPTIELNYTTTHPTTTLVKFKGPDETAYHNYLLSDYATDHKATIEALDPAIEYEVVATGIDENGVEAANMTAKVTTLTDSRPPAITANRAIGRVIGLGKDARANLYVKIETDELTKVKVLFGKGTIMGNFEQSTPEDPSNTYHLITIPVDPGQVYSYVIEAVDMADNKTVSNPATVVVEGAKQNATEIVINTFSDKFGWITKLWIKQ